jgi:transketolase
VRHDHTDENLCARGAYVLAPADGDRVATILATGSEVEIAMTARDALQADGIPTAVVSMPCWELFDAQDEAYQAETLGSGGSVRVAVEAGVTFGWSAPAPDAYKHFGITAEAVVARVKGTMS